MLNISYTSIFLNYSSFAIVYKQEIVKTALALTEVSLQVRTCKKISVLRHGVKQIKFMLTVFPEFHL